MRALTILILPAAAAILISCSQEAADTAKQSKEPPKQYKMHGEVTRVDAQGKVASVNAERIDGWMEAMSMEYPVKDPQDLSALHPNECIDATVFVQGNDFWLANIKPVDTSSATCLTAKKPADVK